MICVKPFNNLHINDKNEISICRFTKNSIQNKNLAINDITNSVQFTNLRESFIRRDTITACDICWLSESKNNKSFRLVSNSNKHHGLDNPLLNISKYIIVDQVQTLEVNLSAIIESNLIKEISKCKNIELINFYGTLISKENHCNFLQKIIQYLDAYKISLIYDNFQEELSEWKNFKDYQIYEKN